MSAVPADFSAQKYASSPEGHRRVDMPIYVQREPIRYHQVLMAARPSSKSKTVFVSPSFGRSSVMGEKDREEEGGANFREGNVTVTNVASISAKQADK